MIAQGFRKGPARASASNFRQEFGYRVSRRSPRGPSARDNASPPASVHPPLRFRRAGEDPCRVSDLDARLGTISSTRNARRPCSVTWSGCAGPKRSRPTPAVPAIARPRSGLEAIRLRWEAWRQPAVPRPSGRTPAPGRHTVSAMRARPASGNTCHRQMDTIPSGTWMKSSSAQSAAAADAPANSECAHTTSIPGETANACDVTAVARHTSPCAARTPSGAVQSQSLEIEFASGQNPPPVSIA